MRVVFLTQLIIGNRKHFNRMSFLISRIPRNIAYALCYLIAVSSNLYFKVFGKRLKENINFANKNIIKTSTLKSKDYILHIAYMFYEVIVEKYKSPKYVVIGEAYIKETLKKGKGAILYSAHIGNFICFGSYFMKAYNCLVVVTGGSKELRPLYKIYVDRGYNIVDYDNTTYLELLRMLKKHLENNGVVILMGDFFRASFKDSILFGMHTSLPRGTAYLSTRLKTDVIACYSVRNIKNEQVIKIQKPINMSELYSVKELEEATNYLNKYIEDMIIDEPAQWFYWFEIDCRFKF